MIPDFNIQVQKETPALAAILYEQLSKTVAFIWWKSRYQGANFCQDLETVPRKAWQKFVPWYLLFHTGSCLKFLFVFTMGSRLVLSKMNNMSDPLEHALPFLDPIDGNALSEAVMGLKPKGGPNPYLADWQKGWWWSWP